MCIRDSVPIISLSLDSFFFPIFVRWHSPPQFFPVFFPIINVFFSVSSFCVFVICELLKLNEYGRHLFCTLLPASAESDSQGFLLALLSFNLFAFFCTVFAVFFSFLFPIVVLFAVIFGSIFAVLRFWFEFRKIVFGCFTSIFLLPPRPPIFCTSVVFRLVQLSLQSRAAGYL